MTKLIIGIAIAAIAITLMTLSNYAYSDPTGDRIIIFVQAEEITHIRSVIVGLGPETGCLPLTNIGISCVVIDVGDGNIWLTYETRGLPLPSHLIFFRDLDWIDQETGEPIPGEIVSLRCEFGRTFFTSDTIGIIVTLLPRLVNEIHCEFTTEHEDPTIDVDIDVKPGSDPSSVNCKNLKGTVPVAIFGAENFDAATIDIEIVSMSLVSSSPITVSETHGLLHLEDLNDDGFDDAVLHLDKAEVCEATATAPLKETVVVELSGETTDGTEFVGTGDIRIVKR